MAQVTINPPAYEHSPFNTGDGVEGGDHPKTIVSKLNTMIGELYNEVGNIPAPPEPGAAVADATDADDIVAQFNALLASLRAAGVIAT